MDRTNVGLIYEPSPDHPGWYRWDLVDQERFNAYVLGSMLVRREDLAGGNPAVRLRMFTRKQHSNLLDAVHGAITLALIDVSLFVCMRHALEGDAAGSVTLDLSTQFIGAGMVGQPLDAVAEVLRETRRLVFLRGTVEQGDHLVAAFNGTVRKPSSR
ncbi:PaaI family thioesterase [Novosphingobium sp. Chol11]|uniref:PaaI family thioesterase n=1 Tax=Novosphingobium sp. Chol11 TaxID=1385763 RepID=UPI0025E0A34D|nr:PaaI family thioesterase [Novosphingobium sp. Chol11]